MARRKCGTRRRRSGGAEIIDPAPYPAALMAEGQQPSNEIMEWATTAGIPAPLNMQNVAHGGKRRTHRKRHGKRSTKRSTKRRTHRKRGGKHSMKRGKRRGGDCGCGPMIRP
jgi:hypothetical protein